MAETLANPFAEDVARLQEAIEHARHVTLEIGTGLLPLPDLEGKRRIGEEGLYIGWNVEPYAHEDLIDHVINKNRFAVYTGLDERESITELIPPGSVNEVVIANVLGEVHYYPEHTGKQVLLDKLTTLALSSKLLEKGGQLTVIETVSPRCAEQLKDKSTAAETLKPLGFEHVTFLPKTDPEFTPTLHQYRTRQGQHPVSGSFILTARKL